jgi:hypothetical protein
MFLPGRKLHRAARLPKKTQDHVGYRPETPAQISAPLKVAVGSWSRNAVMHIYMFIILVHVLPLRVCVTLLKAHGDAKISITRRSTR